MAWSKQAQDREREVVRDFKENLRTIADCLANHEKAAVVSIPHVDRALDALASVGLSRKRWIDRPDAETALGGVLVGASFAAPDVINTLVDPNGHKGIAAGVLVALVGVGGFLFFHGTLRARLPSSESDLKPYKLWGRRFAFLFLASVILIGIAWVAYSYFSRG